MFDPILLFKSRGYPIRKHVAEVGWADRKLTVIDLTKEEERILQEEGGGKLQEVLHTQGSFLFPAIEKSLSPTGISIPRLSS